MYHIRSSKTFEEDIKKLKKREAQVFQKALRLIEEVAEHPESRTGKPEPPGRWSRRLTQKHRLVYRIVEEAKEVHLLSAYGHYDDK